ncbi:MAG: formate/nitrite transporter family protein [Pikeienuella sp.]
MKRSELPPVPFSVSGAVDAHPARRIERLIEDVGVRRAHVPLMPLFFTALLGGALVGIGTVAGLAVLADPGLGLIAGRTLAGLALAVSVVLALLSGGELFAANLLVPMAWMRGHISAGLVRRHAITVFFGNFTGAALAVWAAEAAGLAQTAPGFSEVLAERAAAMRMLEFWTWFWRGALGAFLLAAAVWLTFASNHLTDRILAVLGAVTLLGALGFEHAATSMAVLAAADGPRPWDALGGVALGNILVGLICVPLAYRVIYGAGTHQSG